MLQIAAVARGSPYVGDPSTGCWGCWVIRSSAPTGLRPGCAGICAPILVESHLQESMRRSSLPVSPQPTQTTLKHIREYMAT
jgi:hypothetical protein